MISGLVLKYLNGECFVICEFYKYTLLASTEFNLTVPTAEVCRKHGLCQGTFYKYQSKYGGMEVSDVAKMRSLEDESARLKRLLADTMLDNVVLKDLLEKS
jgi:putative transposase